jgi:origin recognition complex subunit 6
VARSSGSSQKAFQTTRIMLQKVLGVRSGATSRDLCVQFGCARLEPAVRDALATFRARFVARLPPMQRSNADFSRPVFLAAAFALVARQSRVGVDRQRLLGGLGVAAAEFSEAFASMAELLPEVAPPAKEPRKRKAAPAAEEAAEQAGWVTAAIQVHQARAW